MDKKDSSTTSKLLAPSPSSTVVEADSSKKRKELEVARTATDQGDVVAPEQSKRIRLDGHGRASMASTSSSVPRAWASLPPGIWQRIFSFCPPKTLGLLLRVNKLFNIYLDPASPFRVPLQPRELSGGSPFLATSIVKVMLPNDIWRDARRLFWPHNPTPLNGQTELDMWRLACSRKCQFCGKADRRSPLPASDPLHFGPGPDGVTPIWAFRVRCCSSCLASRAIKELDFLMSSIPSFLTPGLPFVFCTPDFHILPPSFLEKASLPSSLIITKLFWSADVESLHGEFLAAKDYGASAVEEWQKGLSSRGQEQRAYFAKWEKFAESGVFRVMRTSLYPGDRELLAVIDPRRSEQKGNEKKTVPQVVASLPPRPLLSPTFQRPQPLSHEPSTALPSSGLPASLPAKVVAPCDTGRAKDNMEVLIAERKAEIVRRASLLDPPMTEEELEKIPAFRAALHITMPFNDTTWDVLKPRLLLQKAKLEGRVPSFPLSNQQNTKDTKKKGEPTEEDWETAQGPIRETIIGYADEAIRDWGNGKNIKSSTAPVFAVDVLTHVYKRFSTEVALHAQKDMAQGRRPTVDPPQGPYTQNLTLENMKYVFETKIRPLTEHIRTDLFLCSVCSDDGSTKLFGFDGVLQHYGAKHTKKISRGSVVVFWRALWPTRPPFKDVGWRPKKIARARGLPPPQASPPKTASSSKPMPQAQGPSSTAPLPPALKKSAKTQKPSCLTEHSGSSTAQHPLPQQQRLPEIAPPSHGASGPVFQGHSSLGQAKRPSAPAQANFTPDTSYSPVAFPDPALAHSSIEHQNRAWPAPPRQLLEAQYAILGGPVNVQKLDELSEKASQLWGSISRMEDVHTSVKAFALLHQLDKFSRRIFREPLSLSLLVYAFSFHDAFWPIRNMGAICCKLCREKDAGEEVKTSEIFYDLPSLINHYDRDHAPKNHGDDRAHPTEWISDMLRVPSLATLLSLAGRDGWKYPLLYQIAEEIQFELMRGHRGRMSESKDRGRHPNKDQGRVQGRDQSKEKRKDVKRRGAQSDFARNKETHSVPVAASVAAGPEVGFQRNGEHSAPSLVSSQAQPRWEAADPQSSGWGRSMSAHGPNSRAMTVSMEEEDQNSRIGHQRPLNHRHDEEPNLLGALEMHLAQEEQRQEPSRAAHHVVSTAPPPRAAYDVDHSHGVAMRYPEQPRHPPATEPHQAFSSQSVPYAAPYHGRNLTAGPQSYNSGPRYGPPADDRLAQTYERYERYERMARSPEPFVPRSQAQQPAYSLPQPHHQPHSYQHAQDYRAYLDEVPAPQPPSDMSRPPQQSYYYMPRSEAVQREATLAPEADRVLHAPSAHDMAFYRDMHEPTRPRYYEAYDTQYADEAREDARRVHYR